MYWGFRGSLTFWKPFLFNWLWHMPAWWMYGTCSLCRWVSDFIGSPRWLQYCWDSCSSLFFFFPPARKHRVLTLITNPMIWPFFRLCSLPVTVPTEILKMIWKWNTCSPQNIPFHLLLSFVLIPLWCLYWGQRGKKVKGCLFISILILGRGREKAKWWTPGLFSVWGCNIQCTLCGWS